MDSIQTPWKTGVLVGGLILATWAGGVWADGLRDVVREAYGYPPRIDAQARIEISQTGYDPVSHLISRETYERLLPVHQQILACLSSRSKTGGPRAIPCFTPGMPPEVIKAFDKALFGSDKFRITSRWTYTASGGFNLKQGDPTVLTYSYCPDGTSIPSGVGEAAGTSNLFATFNALYGSPGVWQALFAEVFDVWSQTCGIIYIHEPSDDGAAFFNNPGELGVRGDVRIGGKYIDGQAGANILAYNYTPNGGDMVLDTSNQTFFGNTSSRSLGLRNVVSHEHGHGIGLLHVCPINQTKLMEPYVSLAFDGPQHDDTLGAQRHYGDINEHNDTADTASDLGTLANGIWSVTTVSLDSSSDVDFFKFTVAAGKKADLIVNPQGAVYLEGQQNTDGSCTAGTSFDSRSINNFGVEILGVDGTTLLATANSQPAGSPETISSLVLPSAGTFFLRVFPGATNNVQMYGLDLTISDQSGPPLPTSTFTATTVPTNTPSSTATRTATRTRTRTATATRTGTPSSTVTSTALPTSTSTLLPTLTSTVTSTDTSLPTASPTMTETPLPSDTPTHSPTHTLAPSETPTHTQAPVSTPTESPTGTALPTSTDSPTATATESPTETVLPTSTDSPTATATESATETALPTSTDSPTATATESPTETALPTSTNSPTPTLTESATQTPLPPTHTFTPPSTATATATETATQTTTDSPTRTETLEPSATATSLPSETATPTASESVTPSLSATPSSTPSPSQTTTVTQTPPGIPAPTQTPVPGFPYDVAPVKTDGKVDSLDLLIWTTRISSGTEEARMLFDFTRFWKKEIDR